MKGESLKFEVSSVGGSGGASVLTSRSRVPSLKFSVSSADARCGSTESRPTASVPHWELGTGHWKLPRPRLLTSSATAIGLLLAATLSAVGQDRGEVLARQHCAACHLFPEPDLLDRATWQNHTLRRMAPMLGVARMRTEGRPDGRRLEESGVFPSSPVLSAEDWSAITAYYVGKAPVQALPAPGRRPIMAISEQFAVEPLTIPASVPLTTLARIDEKRHEIWLGDAGSASMVVFGGRGDLVRRNVLGGAAVDVIADGGGLLVTLIGSVFPSDVPAGKLARVGADGAGAPQVLLEGLERPVQCLSEDLNGDGRRDLLVCGFGNYLGRLAWHERRADGGFTPHELMPKPGAVHAEIRDVDHDGDPDLIVLMAQGREGVFLYENNGKGEFNVRTLLEFHPAFGSVSFELADMDGDGHEDLVLANGDNGEYPSPFKRYHGVRIFLNDGRYRFTERWFHPVHGAFHVVARDFDGDGDRDLAAISFFADYSGAPAEAFLHFENRGGLKFEAQTIAGTTRGRWLTMDAGDADGDGDVDVVLGSFSQGPPAIEIPEALQAAWRTNGVNALLLRNLGKKP